MKTDIEAIGHWIEDADGLPSFAYTGSLPFRASCPNGAPAKLPDDPWFILGNYRLTLFAHASGRLQILTGQRAWGRLNQGSEPNTGRYRSRASVNGKKNELCGPGSLAFGSDRCERVFGCGFARWRYSMEDGVTLTRTISVRPSANPEDGASAWILAVTAENGGSNTAAIECEEAVGIAYEMLQQQRKSPDKKAVTYASEFAVEGDCAIARIKAACADPFAFPERDDAAALDGYPPAFWATPFVGLDGGSGCDAASSRAVETAVSRSEIVARASFRLDPGETETASFLMGYSFERPDEPALAVEISRMKNELGDYARLAASRYRVPPATLAELAGRATPLPSGAFGAEWARILPDFPDEKNGALRREMRWDAYVLEAMATWSEWYRETKIPQGTVYDYDWGIHASARDIYQQALPLVYYNPALAKSSLRYMLKRTTAWGEIRLIEMGHGVANHFAYFTSDQQLFFFQLLSEYLRVTQDFAFLAEEAMPFPGRNAKPMRVIEFVEACWKFLRDEIGTGKHGLVRLLNSDWNDAVFYIEAAPYNRVLFSGESHMNSAMAIAVLGNLVPSLRKAAALPDLAAGKERLELLARSMDLFRTAQSRAFFGDLGDRPFSRRMYFNGKSYGDENMFLEPQGFLMQIPEFPLEKKKRLWEELRNRLLKGEKLGAREQECPEFDDAEFDRGSRENGGIWYALNGPVAVALADFDTESARFLLERMTLENHSRSYPEYWSSWWSAADNVESSLVAGAGLPDQSLDYGAIPVFCAHPHAWPLYCFYRVREAESRGTADGK